jgi:hypothetical protein
VRMPFSDLFPAASRRRDFGNLKSSVRLFTPGRILL